MHVHMGIAHPGAVNLGVHPVYEHLPARACPPGVLQTHRGLSTELLILLALVFSQQREVTPCYSECVCARVSLGCMSVHLGWGGERMRRKSRALIMLEMIKAALRTDSAPHVSGS